ncbi:MAG: biopolymer transporter ExbD [Saprospirales bacterium]|nr:biopolymer transporter ExbD [Saprospirales bacterium]MBK6905270.1 biopolymer transporter ExbD [Saprospirales bacterium]MBK7335062.1 biopolymer transporter ExbD [Saprospirales bacterium]
MALKKRTKASALFNMSSMTDIIFLLLIFFMLTSGLVAPNALNLKMPGSSSTALPSTDRLDDVTVDPQGLYFLNGRRATLFELETNLGAKALQSAKQTQMILSPDPQAPTEAVVAVMDIALRYDIEAILAAEAE